MIVLDTNAVSEFVRPARDARVIDWFCAHQKVSALPTPCVAELFVGAQAMEVGPRKEEFLQIYREICEMLRARNPPFDLAAAPVFPRIALECERKGKPLLAVDRQVASITDAHRASVATRDTAFTATDLEIINPQEE